MTTSSLYTLLPSPLRRTHDGYYQEIRRLFEQPFTDARLEPRRLAPTFGCPTGANLSSSSRLSLSSFIDVALKSSMAPPSSEASTASSSSSFSCFGGQDSARITTTTEYEKNQNLPSPQVSSNTPRKRLGNRQDHHEHDETVSPFRPHQDEVWHEKFEKLVAFKNRFGHCSIPISFARDQGLARWVKRQRYQFKRYHEGKSCAINAGRIQLLESIGFAWDAHAAAWQERFSELKEYKENYGHCNLASHDPRHAQLSTWAKCQRRQYKLFQTGETSNMTEERISVLNSIGFKWSVRQWG